MCGRYAAGAGQDTLVELFQVDEVVSQPGLPPLVPRYNIAPTDPVPAVLERRARDGGEVVRKLVRPRWGLVPAWAKDPAVGARMINARSETVAEKPSFRKAFASRRCLLPADGYYEWYTLPRPDEPELMVMAGLYEFWRNRALPDDHPDAWLTTCTIITTRASDALGRIHDRMPMQVRRRDWDDWLSPELTDPLAAHELLHAPGPDEMAAWAVSKAVGNVRNDSPELILPLEESPE